MVYNLQKDNYYFVLFHCIRTVINGLFVVSETTEHFFSENKDEKYLDEGLLLDDQNNEVLYEYDSLSLSTHEEEDNSRTRQSTLSIHSALIQVAKKAGSKREEEKNKLKHSMQGALKAITDSQLKVEVNDVIQYKQENGIKIPFFEISLFDRDHLVQYLKKSLSEVKRLDIEIRNHFNNRKSIPRLTINRKSQYSM